MISQRCPKCRSSRVRAGYRPTPLWSKLLFRFNLLCNNCNWEFVGFAVPGTVSAKSSKSKQTKKKQPESVAAEKKDNSEIVEPEKKNKTEIAETFEDKEKPAFDNNVEKLVSNSKRTKSKKRVKIKLRA